MTKTAKHSEAEAGLSADQREIFNVLVEDYKAAAIAHVGQLWVNYNILADLVRAGWRKQPYKPN